MTEHLILFAGASAVGKTAILKNLLPVLSSHGEVPCICKIDCIETEDHLIYQNLGYKSIAGLSKDICPDHFLVSNLAELWNWSNSHDSNTLIIESAGLCHRCSPATTNMIAGYVLDCTTSAKAPARLGPTLSDADFIVLTKIDMISQAELEIICWSLHQINNRAVIFPVDGLTGYGVEPLANWLHSKPPCENFEGDTLRHTMPSGICSYCVGETRVGNAYQQGVVAKIDI